MFYKNKRELTEQMLNNGKRAFTETLIMFSLRLIYFLIN